MRITTLAWQQNWLRGLSRHQEQIGRQTTQISAGRQLLRPGDGPGQMPTLLAGQEALDRVEAYRRRTAEARGWMEATDQVLGNAGDVLQRARELLVLASTDSLSPEGRDGVRVEMEQLQEEIGRLGQSQLDGRPLFGGSTMKLRVSDEQEVDMNLGAAGDQLFNGVGGLKAAMETVVGHLRTDASTDQLGSDLQLLDNALSQVLQERAANGVRQARVDRVRSQLDQLEVRLKQHLTDTDGFDLAKAASRLATEQTAYQATLSVVARLSNLSLADYLH